MKPSTEQEKEYMEMAARLGCVLCRRLGWGETPAQLHHPRTGVGAARRAPHSEVIPLCPEHHTGKTGIHGMGRKAFERHYQTTEESLTFETKCLVFDLRQRRV